MTLSGETAAQLLAYLDRILAINEHVNLTAVRDREDAVVRHILDSLSVVPAWRSLTGRPAPRCLVDLGTGGGFPGAVLAAVWPDSRALLVDSTAKKLRAVDEALYVAGITNAETLHARGSDVIGLRDDCEAAFDLGVARAVGPAAKLLLEIAPLIARGGIFLAMKGPEPERAEVAEAARAASSLGFSVVPAQPAAVPGLEARTLLAFRRN